MKSKLYTQGFLSTIAAGFAIIIGSMSLFDNAGIDILSRCFAETVPSVTVESSAQWNATIYKISSGDCAIEWIARTAEIGVIQHRAACTLTLADQMPLLEKICSAFFSTDQNAGSFRTLFWGRLDPDTRNGSRELALRLALAAHKSPGWDTKTGKPKNGDINGFVTAIANSAMIYPELRETFERFRRSIQFSCAEKVLVQRADKLPFYEQLKQQGVKATDKLPFDCMTWFSVVSEAGASEAGVGPR